MSMAHLDAITNMKVVLPQRIFSDKGDENTKNTAAIVETAYRGSAERKTKRTND
jgi:hypothetical protein